MNTITEGTVPVDWRGNLIYEGCIVVWPGRRGAHVWMSEGRVVSVESYFNADGQTAWRIGVRNPANQTDRITFPNPKKMTVV